MKKLVTLFALLTSVVALGNMKENMTLKNGGKLMVTEVGEGSTRNVKLELVGNSQTRVVDLKDIDPIKEVKIADLNKDGVDEIYLVTVNAGSGSYGTLYAYSSRALKEIKVPEMKVEKGYMGHDKFTFADGKILREHPMYKDGDANNKPTGGTMKLEYHLDANDVLTAK